MLKPDRRQTPPLLLAGMPSSRRGTEQETLMPVPHPFLRWARRQQARTVGLHQLACGEQCSHLLRARRLGVHWSVTVPASAVERSSRIAPGRSSRSSPTTLPSHAASPAAPSRRPRRPALCVALACCCQEIVTASQLWRMPIPDLPITAPCVRSSAQAQRELHVLRQTASNRLQD